MTLPHNPNMIQAEKVVAPTEPKPTPKHGGIRDRLVYGGRQPYAMPEQMTGVLAVLQGLVGEAITELTRLNESPVLWAGIVQLDADGLYTANLDVLYRCVSLVNLDSAGTVTIAPGGAGDPTRPPSTGAGVHQIPAGNAGLFAVMGNSLTVYGNPGQYVDLGLSARWLPGF